jgi:hypothetical protein
MNVDPGFIADQRKLVLRGSMAPVRHGRSLQDVDVASVDAY